MHFKLVEGMGENNNHVEEKQKWQVGNKRGCGIKGKNRGGRGKKKQWKNEEENSGRSEIIHPITAN